MNKYLLSSGTITDSYADYIIDIFSTRVRLLDIEIPLSDNNGIKKTYSGIDYDVMMDAIYYNVENLARDVSRNLSVKEIVPSSDGFTININYKDSEYVVTIGN